LNLLKHPSSRYRACLDARPPAWVYLVRRASAQRHGDAGVRVASLDAPAA